MKTNRKRAVRGVSQRQVQEVQAKMYAWPIFTTRDEGCTGLPMARSRTGTTATTA